MNTTSITAIAFSVLATFACMNEQDKSKQDKGKQEKPLVVRPAVKKEIVPAVGEIKTEPKPELARSCGYMVTEMLTTSPRYKQLTKGLNEAVVNNGGEFSGMSLERSPDPEKDKAWSFSKNYEFLVYEMYTDRRLTTANFSFDPVNKQLYEYNPVSDTQEPIAFNKKLLVKYNESCK